MRDAVVPLGGRDWNIRFVRRKDLPSPRYMGLCNRESLELLIYKRLPQFDLLDTLIHECRHAQNRVLFEAEEFIDETSTELARAILKTRVLQDG